MEDEKIEDPLTQFATICSPDTNGPNEVMSRALDVLYSNGTYPHWRNTTHRHVSPESPIGPGYGQLLRSSSGRTQARYGYGRSRQSRYELHIGDGWMMRAGWAEYDSQVTLDIIAITPEVAEKVLADTQKLLDTKEIPEDKIEMKFRYAGANGSAVRHRQVELATWDEIKTNYARSCQPELDRIMNLTPDDVHGRLMLLHGPTGTGKTTYLRALIRTWSKWCSSEYIMDPDKMFGNADYLLSAAVAGGSDAGDFGSEEDDPGGHWRLLILEDTGELLAGSAKAEMGQALSRLLNITDGLPGQGLNLLLAITSNEDLSYFHPAIVRPGRCLANIEVPEVPYFEAVDWMKGEPLPGKRAYTLAELITLREGGTVSRDTEQIGNFL